MLIKVFDLKKSDIFNYYVAEYHNAKQVTEVGFECEYFTDALGTKFPKRVSSNEISRSVL